MTEYVKLKSYYVTNHFRFIFMLVLGLWEPCRIKDTGNCQNIDGISDSMDIDKHAGHW